MKQIFLTLIITFVLLGAIIGGVIFFVVKTGNPKGKEGKCQWQSQDPQYKNISCQAFVNKQNIVTINLKNLSTSSPFLTSVSFIKCSNKNNYFMCVGLRKPCQIINQKERDYQAKCDAPWGPMEVKADFNIGTAMIKWER